MTPGRCLRLAAFAPPLLLIPPWAASFVRSFDALVAGPYAAAYGALNGGRLDLKIHTSRRGFPPPAFKYGVYTPSRYDPLWGGDILFAGFGFGRTGSARSGSADLTCPPWFVPLALLAPGAAVVRRRLRSAPAGAHEADRRRTYARRIMLASPVLAAMLTICVCEAADASSARRRAALNWAPAAALALGPLLAAAGSAAGGLVSAPRAPPERRKAAAARAPRGFVDYWLALMGLSLLIVLSLMGLSLLIL